MATKPNKTGERYKRTVLDPRVALFKAYYTDPNSPTFCNILQSGIRAGYSEQYSQNISAQRPQWWDDMQNDSDVKRAEMLATAEKRLNERLVEVPEDKEGLKIQTDVAKFVSERLGKAHYSTRQEITGKDGRRLFTNEQRASASVPLANLFKGVEQPK